MGSRSYVTRRIAATATARGRQIFAHRTPEDFSIDAKIFVDDDVAHADHLLPGQVRIGCLRGGRDLSCGLADDLERTCHRVGFLRVPAECVKIDAGDELRRMGGRCQDVLQVVHVCPPGVIRTPFLRGSPGRSRASGRTSSPGPPGGPRSSLRYRCRRTNSNSVGGCSNSTSRSRSLPAVASPRANEPNRPKPRTAYRPGSRRHAGGAGAGSRPCCEAWQVYLLS